MGVWVCGVVGGECGVPGVVGEDRVCGVVGVDCISGVVGECCVSGVVGKGCIRGVVSSWVCRAKIVCRLIGLCVGCVGIEIEWVVLRREVLGWERLCPGRWSTSSRVRDRGRGRWLRGEFRTSGCSDGGLLWCYCRSSSCRRTWLACRNMGGCGSGGEREGGRVGGA